MSTSRSILETIQGQPEANGLALIITNDYHDNPELNTIPGTYEDGEKMHQAFQHLKFATYWECNVTSLRLEQLIYDATHHENYSHVQLRNYKCIVFVFSGHGFKKEYIYMQDGKTINIVEKIVKPFLPKSARKIGSLPKLFFIDACRGKEDMDPVVVPRGSGKEAEPKAVERGVTEEQDSRVAPEGNYLIAYSTMPEHKSYELKGKGGIWMTTLAEKLCTSHDSIEDILATVSEEMMEKYQTACQPPMQQPERVSRLNKKLFLFPEINGDAMELDPMVNRVSPQPMESQHIPPSMGGDPRGIHHASSVWSAGISTGSTTPNYVESSMSEDAEIQLKQFCQTHRVKPQFNIIEDASSGQCRYKCTINYRINGRLGRIDSLGYHASKAEAKEKAIRVLVAKDTTISSRGPSPTAKIWKSKLEEYYDKLGQAGVQPKYVTKQCSKDGYRCTLFSPKIGYIRGDICRSKAEAEQCAAYKALRKLK